LPPSSFCQPIAPPISPEASRQLKRVTMKFLRDIDHRPVASGWADELRNVESKPRRIGCRESATHRPSPTRP